MRTGLLDDALRLARRRCGQVTEGVSEREVGDIGLMTVFLPDREKESNASLDAVICLIRLVAMPGDDSHRFPTPPRFE